MSYVLVDLDDLSDDTAFYVSQVSVPFVEPRCKDCKWWKDSDGKFRRGCGAESPCPINTSTVYCGEGYCYMFSLKTDMSEVKE